MKTNFPILPKAWKPKSEYVEVGKGEGLEYSEQVILKSDAKEWISKGWTITRLSKLSPSMVHGKWAYAIAAMEG